MKKSFKYAIATLACASALCTGCTSNKSNADSGNIIKLKQAELQSKNKSLKGSNMTSGKRKQRG